MHAGDSHNFGRRVVVEGASVRKPRTVLWEWLVLSAESPLRKVLDGLGGFDFLPDLRVDPPADPRGGAVDRVTLSPLPDDVDRERLADVVGRTVALFSWLGVADLHWENLALGMDRDRLVFSPLDVEMVLADFALPTDTKLVPDPDPEWVDVCRHAAGVRRALPWLGKPVDPALVVALAAGYRAAFAALDGHARAIADAIASAPGLTTAPIRVCLRGTDQYVAARGAPVWPPLLPAESEQLARGDIPYFFRLYGAPGIRHYTEPSLAEVGVLPREGDVPRLEPLLSLSKGLRSAARKRLRDEGLFAVIGAFDHPAAKGTHERGRLRVTFHPRTLVVRLPSGEELETRRDLSAFVANVYLPCRCGEVRDVLVPPVTTCSPVGTPRRRY